MAAATAAVASAETAEVTGEVVAISTDSTAEAVATTAEAETTVEAATADAATAETTAEAETVEVAAPADDTKGSPETGVAGVAAVAGAVMVATKKSRK